MEKRILGIILSLVGIIALIVAAVYFINANGAGGRRIKEIVVYGLLGAVFFFSGIGLVRNTRDKAT